jgi:beta-glucanase (GH16 family)
MSRRTGLIIFCLAGIIAFSFFAYNLYFSSQHSSAAGNAFNSSICSANCLSSPTSPLPTPTITPTPTSTSQPLTIPGFKLTWHDEFTGTRLDSSKWYAINNQGGSQQQICCLGYSYSSLISPEQLRVHDGMLTITTERNTTGGAAYRTGAITTETQSDTPTFAFTYGRIDVRAKLPAGRGVWPAIWLLTSPATAQVSYEIDMMEMLGQDPHTLYEVVHHGNGREYCTSPGPNYSQGFHIFTLDWEPGKLTWSIDGQQLCTATRYVPQQPMYLILNTALSSGSWGEAVNSSTPLPQTFDIDYVRVYKHNS